MCLKNHLILRVSPQTFDYSKSVMGFRICTSRSTPGDPESHDLGCTFTIHYYTLQYELFIFSGSAYFKNVMSFLCDLN